MSSLVDQISKDNFTSNDNYEKYRNILYQVETEKELYKKMLFAQRTERYVPMSPDQIEFDGLDSSEAMVTTEEVSSHIRTKKVKKHPGRGTIPSHIPRKISEIIPGEVRDNEADYEEIGKEVTEQLEMSPAKFWVKRTERPKYKHKESGEIVCGNLPPHLFSKFKAGNSVIANILTSKYTDHLPLYRINKIFKRGRIDIPEATMVGWIAASCSYLKVLYIEMLNRIANAKLIQADETPIPVLEQGNPKTHRGYMFVYVVDKRYTVFDYCYGRGREGPLEILEEFKGILQTDGYAGYNAIVEKNGLVHVACMAHIRRKFFDAQKIGEKVSEEALIFIKKLYDIEREIKDKDLIEIKKERIERAIPILLEFKNWAIEKKKQFIPQSPTGKAISYFLNEYDKMENYIHKPEADIDNNLCERTIRPLTIGRKNYMFAGSDQGAKRAAIIYSLVLTCRMHGVDPYAYFVKVFEEMAENPDIDVGDLLPDAIKL